jgi:hypothetical protein
VHIQWFVKRNTYVGSSTENKIQKKNAKKHKEKFEIPFYSTL